MLIVRIQLNVLVRLRVGSEGQNYKAEKKSFDNLSKCDLTPSSNDSHTLTCMGKNNQGFKLS